MQLKTVTFGRKCDDMSTQDKLIKRFRTMPKDFTFDETVRLFSAFGFVLDLKGGTSGSRVAFVNKEKGLSYNLHKPHPDNVMKMYSIRQIAEFMIDNKLIEK